LTQNLECYKFQRCDRLRGDEKIIE
jgi:hypothetical protein